MTYRFDGYSATALLLGWLFTTCLQAAEWQSLHTIDNSKFELDAESLRAVGQEGYLKGTIRYFVIRELNGKKKTVRTYAIDCSEKVFWEGDNELAREVEAGDYLPYVDSKPMANLPLKPNVVSAICIANPKSKFDSISVVRGLGRARIQNENFEMQGRAVKKYILCELQDDRDYRKKEHVSVELVEETRQLNVNGKEVSNPVITDAKIAWQSQDYALLYQEFIEINRYTGAWNAYVPQDPTRTPQSQGKCEVHSKRAF